MSQRVLMGLALVASFSMVGCNSGATPTEKAAVAPDARYVLQVEPQGAVGVVDFKDKAQTGEQITVVGRIGGGIDPWVKGRAAFMLVDEGAPMPCEDEHCEECAKEIAECATMVKFSDPLGKILTIDSRELLGIKEEETVVVKGVAKRDGDGNVALIADSVYIRR